MSPGHRYVPNGAMTCWVLFQDQRRRAVLLPDDESSSTEPYRSRVQFMDDRSILWVSDEVIQLEIASSTDSNYANNIAKNDNSHKDSCTTTERVTTRRHQQTQNKLQRSKSPSETTHHDTDARPSISKDEASMVSSMQLDCKSTPTVTREPVDCCIVDLINSGTTPGEESDKNNPVEAQCQQNHNHVNTTNLPGQGTGTETGPSPLYTHSTSAYLQNLAEIVHIVLHDERWRIRKDDKPILRWESGDDLSAIILLDRLFLPPSTPPLVYPARQCRCLLCRREKPYTRTPFQQALFREFVHEPHDEKNHDTVLARRMHLYCRLFYRKGPWFRLDDVFARYYAPKGAKSGTSLLDLDTNQEPHEANNECGLSKTPFCQRRMKPLDQKKSSPEVAYKHILDTALLEAFLGKITELLQDLQALEEMGLIRTFRDEEECGKTVGVQLLSAEERKTILNKLGVSKTKKSARRDIRERENQIWKQMRQQRTIFAPKINGSGYSLMPVRRHVAGLLLDKLGSVILQACSVRDDIPSYTMNSVLTYISSRVQHIAASGLETKNIDIFCFRLREEPSAALQRCVRVFLCVTNGPGEMRGNGTNGWRSLMCRDSSRFPMRQLVQPPCLETFSDVVYPGLMYRLGLSSSNYLDSYYQRPQQEPSHINWAGTLFESVDSLNAWETMVEVRASVDYLLELTESIRYHIRRKNKGLRNIDGSDDFNLSFESADVDTLRLLDSQGAQMLAKNLLSDIKYNTLDFDELIRMTSHRIDSLPWQKCSICDGLLLAFATLLSDVLWFRLSKNAMFRKGVPWARHLSIDACLAYAIWDLVPILERYNLYREALSCLTMLVCGQRFECTQTIDDLVTHFSRAFERSNVCCLLSRRARGKALDRFVIDVSHATKEIASRGGDPLQRKNERSRIAQMVLRMCESLVCSLGKSSGVSYSALRSIAKRLKRPLHITMTNATCLEANELSLRFKFANDAAEDTNKYSDWTPVVDTTIANALNVGERIGSGQRCMFVGYDDNNLETAAFRSLNVEELAAQMYQTGRLPTINASMGWHGFHDEGANIRALFRLLCAPLLGFDWSCLSKAAEDNYSSALMSPYQGSPFCLHAGYELNDDIAVPSFYGNYYELILDYLSELERLSSQELCDYIYDCFTQRLEYQLQAGRKDPQLNTDLLKLRTLSMIAAGCGGRLLAAAFRCLCFDYRHYSGGLPDLLLVRVVYEDNDTEIVGLPDFIGESFVHDEETSFSRSLSLVTDDEFLGCNKVGDSRGARSSKAKPRSRPRTSIGNLNDTILPSRLLLNHNGRRVRVECMMIEVKSANDRLDVRQEDWLNILDQYGNARVCKFEDSRQKRRRDISGLNVDVALPCDGQASGPDG